MLATPEYAELNRQMHEQKPMYGAYGRQWATEVRRLVKAYGLASVLDYGAGKRSLETALAPAIPVTSYDPAVPEISAHPTGKVDLVVCTDVLEHIEPDCLEAVLDDLAAFTGRMAFFEISNEPARKHLPDGRNAHLIVEPPRWWLPKLDARWKVQRVSAVGGRLVVHADAKVSE